MRAVQQCLCIQDMMVVTGASDCAARNSQPPHWAVTQHLTLPFTPSSGGTTGNLYCPCPTSTTPTILSHELLSYSTEKLSWAPRCSSQQWTVTLKTRRSARTNWRRGTGKHSPTRSCVYAWKKHPHASVNAFHITPNAWHTCLKKALLCLRESV